MDELIQRLDRFVSAADNSNEAAHRIAVLIGETFPEDPHAMQLAADLGRYHLGGGEGFLDFEAMRARLVEMRPYLVGAI